LNLRQARQSPTLGNKISDSDAENSETDTWLDFALSCGYIDEITHRDLTEKCREIGAMLGSMIKNPEKFLSPT